MATQKTHIGYDVINHDGGSHIVEAEANTDGTATIRFGSSFTLRLDEHNVDKLRQLLHDVSCHLMNGPLSSMTPIFWKPSSPIPEVDDTEPHYPGWRNVPVPPAPEVRDTLKAWADEKEDYKHLLDLSQCSEV